MVGLFFRAVRKVEEVELIKEDMLLDDVSWVQFSRYLLSLCASFLLERWNPGPSREGIWARRSVTPAHRQSLIEVGKGSSGSALYREGLEVGAHRRELAASCSATSSSGLCPASHPRALGAVRVTEMNGTQ